VFAANYRMVTLIPVVFGAGKWVANIPTGYFLDRLGRTRLMVTGLLVVAACDLASVAVTGYAAFLGVRACAGAGWAMFATVATTALVSGERGRGRAISRFLLAETLGLLLGSAGGGWIYAHGGRPAPFFFEAGCMVAAAAAAGWTRPPPAARPAVAGHAAGRGPLRTVLRQPGFGLLCVTGAAIAGIQTGVLVFLLPLYLVERGGVSPEAVGSLIALSVLGRLGGLWLAGGVATREARVSALALGLLGFGASLGTLVLVTDPWLFGAWMLLLGATAGFVAGLPTTLAGDSLDPRLHGVAIGWLRTAADAGMLLGPLVMGPLADRFGLSVPFLLATALTWTLAPACRRTAS